MPNRAVRAAAEGLPKVRVLPNAPEPVSRRSFLTALAVAPAAVALPGTVVHAAPVSECDRMTRLHGLAEETSDAFDVWNSYMGGKWELRIRAADDPCPILFQNLKSVEAVPAYDALFSASDRLQHHLLMAIQALNELTEADRNLTYSIFAHGAAGKLGLYNAVISDCSDAPKNKYGNRVPKTVFTLSGGPDKVSK